MIESNSKPDKPNSTITSSITAAQSTLAYGFLSEADLSTQLVTYELPYDTIARHVQSLANYRKTHVTRSYLDDSDQYTFHFTDQSILRIEKQLRYFNGYRFHRCNYSRSLNHPITYDSLEFHPSIFAELTKTSE